MIDLKLDKDKMTKYEKARIIGARSMQISMGAPLLARFTPKKLEEINYDTFEIAKIEYEEGLLPLEIER